MLSLFWISCLFSLQANYGSLFPKSSLSFADRTCKRGDLVIVDVDTNETGQWQDNTNMQRNNNGTDLSGIAKTGVNALLRGKLDLNPLDFRGVRKHNASAGSRQSVRIIAKIPATVVKKRGGRVHIKGTQEIAFGNEKRSVEVSGICMVDDIQAGRIKFSQLAEGKLFIKSRGDFSDIKRIPFHQRIMNRVF